MSKPKTMAFCAGLTGEDFVFRQVPVRFKGCGTIEYNKWVDVGMPSVPKRFLDCVVYLYADTASATLGKGTGGCGFIAGVRSKTHPSGVHLYVVSNFHVAKKGFPVVRLNTPEGGVSTLDLDALDWEHIPNGGDVAAASVDNFGGGNFLCVTDDLLLTKEDCGNLFGLGDDVVMVGRFMDHDGGQTNRPALRFGNISLEPTNVAWQYGASVEYFCLDMHSRSGFSGAPVFAYRTPGSDLANTLTEDGKPRDTVVLTSRETRIKLLGINCGQFPEIMELEMVGYKDKVRVKGLSGMTVCLPAWSVLEVLNCPKFVQERASLDAQWKERNFAMPEASKKRSAPMPESATLEDHELPPDVVQKRFNATLKTMLNTPPQPHGKKAKMAGSTARLAKK